MIANKESIKYQRKSVTVKQLVQKMENMQKTAEVLENVINKCFCTT